jgi:hypothetical protein
MTDGKSLSPGRSRLTTWQGLEATMLRADQALRSDRRGGPTKAKSGYARPGRSISQSAPRRLRITVAENVSRCSICKSTPSPTGPTKLSALLAPRGSSGIALWIVSHYRTGIAAGRAFPRGIPAAMLQSTSQSLRTQHHRTPASGAAFDRDASKQIADVIADELVAAAGPPPMLFTHCPQLARSSALPRSSSAYPVLGAHHLMVPVPSA